MGLIDKSCHRDVTLLTADEMPVLLDEAEGWNCADDGKSISRKFSFPGYVKTMAFVNTVASIADQQDHHPDMLVSYNCCTVTFSTHSVGGLSENDFICAVRINSMEG